MTTHREERTTLHVLTSRSGAVVMLKTLTKKILGYFDLSVTRKSNQDRIDRDYRTLKREYKQLKKILFELVPKNWTGS
jgi:hypothetical protein